MAPAATTEAASTAALTGTTIDRAKDALRHLENSSLIYQYRPNRYRMHDLVRLYAAERAGLDEDPHSRDQAMRRVLDHYLFTGYAGDRLIAEHRRAIDLGSPPPGSLPLSFPNDLAAVQWFDSEHSNILAAQSMAVTNGWLDRVWHFAWVLDSFHWRRGLLLADITSWEAGLAAAQSLHDAFAIGLAHRRLGRAYGRAARYRAAVDHMTIGLSYAEDADDAPGQAHARRILSWLCHQLADDQAALDHATSSIRIYEQLGNPVWTAHALDELGVCYMRLGRYDLALECSSQALALHREHQHGAGVAESLDTLGNIMAAMGEYATAMSNYQEALTLFRTLDNTYDEANVLEHLGNAYSRLGQLDQANQAWREALALYQLAHRVAEAERVTQFLSAANQ
jgi:tetratricopeptide (TPR) repeat protein